MAFRTGNPALGATTFSGISVASDAGRMSLQGTVNKSLFLLAITVACAGIPWSQASSAPLGLYALGGSVAGLLVALLTTFRKEWSPLLGPVYAAVEGLALGAISAQLDRRFPGIVIPAVALTFGIFFALLVAYSSGAIRPSENFKLGVVAATGGVALVYLISLVGRLFGYSVPYIHDAGPVGIGFSVVVVAIAAANLVLDFDFIESGVRAGAPRYMEWYAAFGLLVTLVWLYFEILRLLAKIRSR